MMLDDKHVSIIIFVMLIMLVLYCNNTMMLQVVSIAIIAMIVFRNVGTNATNSTNSNNVQRPTTHNNTCNGNCGHALNSLIPSTSQVVLGGPVVRPVDVYDEVDGTQTPPPSSPAPDDQHRFRESNPYAWMSNPKYTGCYPQVPYEVTGCNLGAYLPFDEANSRMAALRQRDKKTLDGYVTKNSNYYKKHFANELGEAEQKRWWGSNEY